MTIDEKIAEAETALHKLMMGSVREEVQYDGKRVRFTKADIPKLKGYVAELKAEKAGEPTRGAIGFAF